MMVKTTVKKKIQQKMQLVAALATVLATLCLFVRNDNTYTVSFSHLYKTNRNININPLHLLQSKASAGGIVAFESNLVHAPSKTETVLSSSGFVAYLSKILHIPLRTDESSNIVRL